MPHYTANCSDFNAISVCFNDPEIGLLFAELLESRGLETKIYTCEEQIPSSGKIVTEPCFFNLLPERMKKKNCLLVSNPLLEKNIDAIVLERPLTASKIEAAISELLS